MEFTYVCSLIGNDVFHGHSVIGCISHVNNIDKVREKIKTRYDIEFEELASVFNMFNNGGYLCFTNITDKRDIYLVVERTYFI